VQPGSTTSLTVTSDSMTFAGSVYSPPISFVAGSSDVDGSAQDAAVANACSVQISQNGNQLSGTICGRTAGVSL
ncbi:MAG: hypothetical protein ACRELY_04680, partial [Polyangiaceae bacterium]